MLQYVIVRHRAGSGRTCREKRGDGGTGSSGPQDRVSESKRCLLGKGRAVHGVIRSNLLGKRCWSTERKKKRLPCRQVNGNEFQMILQ